jgi:hypothetical protein
MLGALAANNLGFGLALAEICQTFAWLWLWLKSA